MKEETSCAENLILRCLTDVPPFDQIYSHEFSRVEVFVNHNFPSDPRNNSRLDLARKAFRQLQIIFIRDNNPVWNGLVREPRRGWESVFSKTEFVDFCDRYHEYLQWARKLSISEITIAGVFSKIAKPDPVLAKRISTYAAKANIDLRSPMAYRHCKDLIQMVPEAMGRATLENAFETERQYLKRFEMKDHLSVAKNETAEMFWSNALGAYKDVRRAAGFFWEEREERVSDEYDRETGGNYRSFLNTVRFDYSQRDHEKKESLKITEKGKKPLLIDVFSDLCDKNWPSPSPEDELILKEEPLVPGKSNEQWNEDYAKAKLTRQEREIMELKRSGLSLKQIARKKLKTENAIAQSFQNAKEKMRRRLH
jgi:hypothetical protein